MIIKYNKERLKQIICDISDLTGISIGVLDTEYNFIVDCKSQDDFCSNLQKYQTASKYCALCDENILKECANNKRIVPQLCHAGLCDFAMPIFKNEIIVGYVIMGRIRCSESPKVHTYSNLNDINLNKKYGDIPILSNRQIAALCDLMPKIIFDSGIEIENDTLCEEITQYINQNISKRNSINDLCNNFHISKTTLYGIFKNNFNTTVNDYILNQKIAIAKKLLKETDMPVYEISERIGFENYTYFCKLFKQKEGKTATAYRKEP